MFFAVIAHDKPGRHGIRIESRAGHKAYIKRGELPARLLFETQFAKDDAKTTIGTLLIVEAPDRTAVETYLTGDPYVVNDVFERIDILAMHESFADAARELFSLAE